MMLNFLHVLWPKKITKASSSNISFVVLLKKNIWTLTSNDVVVAPVARIFQRGGLKPKKGEA